MRYEDNSQAGGIAQGQAPDARSDNDALTAGTRTPAEGNVITGDGTKFGPMSSDMADGGHITKVSGAGGSDSSAVGGKLHVGGEYGQLTMDANGNYHYQPKANVPENVKDVFTYTLADAHGRVDTAELIIEFGKTPAVIKANAQQIVPGPDGVVVLPEGVQLSDIMIVGRNLVINLPDGTQMVIVDGAVFVPQLVLGGVEVPPTNLATLLIDSEPQPGAGGPPPSSGGNFEVPVPPLDPGVPLGDLIPPTEMVYTPPEVREVFDTVDREPTISIDPGDGVPVINAVDQVREAGLPTRNGGEPAGSGESADGNGANNSDASEATTGTILYDSPDGVSSITINGVLVTSVGQVIAGDFGTMVITSIAPGAIGYNYVLGDNTSGDATHDDFEVTITDPDGDQATATLQVNIVDDTPTAVNDTDSIAAGEFGPATGNVISDASAGDAGDSDNGKDTVGADNALVSAVSGAGGSDNSFDGDGNLVVNGQYGVLTIKADGSYSYVRNEGTPGGVSDVFTYTLTDGDGDNASATLTITIADALPITGENATAQLDDDAQANGNPGGTGDDPDGVNLSGVLAASGGDGSLTYAFQSSGAPSGFTYQVQANGDLWVLQGGTHVLTVTLDTATGAYEVSQVAPIDHAAGGDENNLDFTITYKVTDIDGDSATGTLHVNVDDDTPVVDPVLDREASLVVDESGPTSAAAIATPGVTKGDDPNVTGSGAIGHASSGTAIVDLNASFGADGPAAGGGISYALNVTNANSGLTLTDGSAINLVELGNGVVVGVVQGGAFAGQAAFAIAIDPVTGVVTVEQYLSLDHPVNPNPNDPLGLGEGTLSVVGTATDGDGDSVSTGDVDISNLITFLDDGPTIDPALNANATVTVDESLPSGTPGIDTGSIVKGDDPDLSGGLAIGQANSGSAVVNANAVFGADGPAAGGGIGYALSITSTDPGLTLTDGTPIELQMVNGVIVGVVQGGDFDGEAAFAIAINPTTGVVTVEQYLSLDHPVNPNPNDPLHIGEGAVGVVVTATDGDGDPVSSDAIDISGQITFLDDGPTIDPAVNANATVTVDESLPSDTPGINTGAIVKGDDPDLAGGLALGQANSGVAIVNANAVFGADGPAAEGSLSYALSITNASSGLTLTDGTPISLQMVNGVIVGVVQGGTFDGQAAFAIAINSSTGVVTVEQYLSLDHPLNPNPNDPLGLGEGTVGVVVTATDGDGDPVTSDAVDISGQITFLDDGPTIDPVVNQRATVTVDESLPSDTAGINTGSIVKGDDPDLAGGLALGQASSGVAIVNANAVFGADGPAAGGGLAYALSITNASSGLTLTDGTPIELQMVNGVIVGVVQGGTFDGQAAFAIAINSSTGVVTVEQYLSLDHPLNPNPNDPLGLGEGTVGVVVTATDGDGDPVTSDAVDISGQITFLDDGPSIDPALNANATVTVDESLPSGTPGIDTGSIVKGDDPDLSGGLAIGQANSGSAVVNANAVFGADGPAAGGGIGYALSITSTDPGLTLTDGTPIELQMVNGVIVGVVQGGDFDGQAAFAIAINPTTGVVTVEQYLSLDHPVNPNPNDPLHIGEGAVGVVVTATDGDGDPVSSDAIDISGQITFLDDGPTVNPSVNTQATVTVDETAPSNTAGINTGAIVKGDDPDLSGGLAIGQANSGSAIVNANAVFGADGPALQGSISYALSIINAASGLTLTDGTPISLQMVNGVIVGVVQGGTFNGQAAFAIAINSSTGVVTVEQYLSLDHPINPNPNDPLSFGSNIIGVTVTATDGDGDPVTSGAVDIGGQITFLDDGPSANNDHDVTDPITDQAVGNVISGSGTVEGTGNADSPGADGFGSITNLVGYNGSTDSNPTGGFDVNGQYGTLHMNLDGSYTYTRTSGPGGAVETFVYTYVDGDGDPASATLTITIADNTPTLNDPALIRLDDDVIPGANGNVDGPSDDDPDTVGQNVVNGQLVGSGGDGDLDYRFTGVNTLPSGFSIGAGSDADTLLIVQDQGGTLVTVMTVQLDLETGAFSVTQNAPIWHPADNGGPDDNIENNVLVSVGVEVVDLDGDTDPASININIDDDTPTINVTKGDDSAISLTTDDADTIGVATDTSSSSANFGGVFGLTQSAGADGTNAAATLSYALDVTGFTGGPGGVASGLQSHDVNIFLYEIGGKVVGSTSATLAGVNAGNTIFDVSVSGSGVVTLTQYQQIDHDTVDPTPTGSPYADHVVSLVDSLVTLTASASLTDKDGDTVTDSETVNIGANLHFTDHGPSAAIVNTGANVSVDETNGNQGDSNDVTGPLAVFNGVLNKGTDADMSGPQFGTSASAIVASTGSSYGADGAGTTVFGLNVAPGGVDSGLDTTAGVNIFLFLENGIVVGRVGATALAAASGPAAFAIAIDPSTGVVSMVEYMSINHPNTGSFDESVSIANGAIQATVTVTDFDGDTSTSSVNIGDHIQFQDDGPTAGIALTGSAVAVDETAGLQGDANDVAGPLAVFSGVAAKGVDLYMVPQYATNAAAIVTAASSAYGADGAGSTVLSLAIASDGVDSGLNTTDGHDIVLHVEGGLVVGRVVGGADDGKAAFAIAIDSTGHISVVEYLSIQHPNTGSLDESVSITNGAIQAVVTVTDGDGDHTTQSVNIGNQIQFQDDGPTAVSAAAITSGLTNGSGSASAKLDGGAGGNIILGDNWGSDGPGSVIFTSASIAALTGQHYKHAGTELSYVISPDGKTLTGFVDTTANGLVDAGETVFTIQLQTGVSGDEYTVTMSQTIDTTVTTNFDDTLFDFIGGNKGWFGIVPNGENTTPVDNDSHDLLITPTNNTSINTSGILGGVDTGQSVGVGEGFRIDYVVDLTGSPPNNYTNGSASGANLNAGDPAAEANHWYTNGAFVTMRQSTGSDVKFTAYNDTNNNQIVGDGTVDQITKIVITFTNNAGTAFSSGDIVRVDTALHNVTLNGVTFSYQFNADGTVDVHNVQGASGANNNPATTVAIYTDTGAGFVPSAADPFGYDSLVVTNIGGDEFKFAGFGAVTTTAAPLDISVPISIVDGDGDVVSSGNLAIHANAATPPVVLDLNGDGVHFLSQDAGVQYDYGNGLVSTAWVAADDGLLVRDGNGNGTVDGASEFVFGHDGLTDLQALRAVYGDTLDASDADFAKFGVWQDANSNGSVDAGEYKSLAAAGITSISLVSDGVSYQAADGDVTVAGSGTYTSADGSTGSLADASFATGSVDQDQQRIQTNSSSLAVAAAVAAAGLAALPAAAHGIEHANPTANLAVDGAMSHNMVTFRAMVDDAQDHWSLGNASDSHALTAQAPVSASRSSAPTVENHSLAGDAHGSTSAPVEALVADSHAPAIDLSALSHGAALVGMPSAAALAGAAHGQAGNAVGQVLADALGGNLPKTIDSLLAHLGNGHSAAGESGQDAAASAMANPVHGWDIGAMAAFGPHADMFMKMDAMLLHHDAVQPAVNG